MGLGSLVIYSRTVMENEYHYNVRKEEDFVDKKGALRIARGDASSSSPPQRNGLFAMEMEESIQKEAPSHNGRMEERHANGLIPDNEVNGGYSLEKPSNLGLSGITEDGESSLLMNGDASKKETIRSRTEKQANSSMDVFTAPGPCSLFADNAGTGDASKGADAEKLNGGFYDEQRVHLTNGTAKETSEKSASAAGCCGTDLPPYKLVFKERTLPPLNIAIAEGSVDAESGSSTHADSASVHSATVSADGFHFPSPVLPSPRFRVQSDSGLDDRIRLPSEQTLNQALEFFKLPDAEVSAQSSTLPSPSSKRASTSTSPSRKKEVAKRRTLQQRLDRIRNRDALVYNIPAFKQANTTQLAILLRRFKKQLPVKSYLSDELFEHVLNNGLEQEKQRAGEPKPELERRSYDDVERVKLRALRLARDADATDSSSDDGEFDESIPSTSTSSQCISISRESLMYRVYQERVEICARDELAAFMEDECRVQCETISKRLAEIRAKKRRLSVDQDGEETCARCRAFDGSFRERLSRAKLGASSAERSTWPSPTTKGRAASYAAVDEHVHPEFSSPSAICASRREQLYLYRRSTRPNKLLRRRWDYSPWASACDESRKGVIEEVDERRKRRRESIEPAERTAIRKAHRNSYHSSGGMSSPLKLAGKRLVKRSLDQKRNGERRIRSNGGRQLKAPSVPNMAAQGAEFDESLPDSSLPGLLQKIDYKEICIPKWSLVRPSRSSFDVETACAHAEYSTMAEVARRHLPLELSERKRFQQYRDFVASQVSGGSAPSKLSAQSKLSGSCTSARSVSAESVSSGCSPPGGTPSPAVPPPSVDDELSSSATELSLWSVVPDYDRPSLEKPYSPRSFPLSSTFVHAIL